MRMLRLTSLALAGVVAVVVVTPAPVRAQQVDIKPPAKVKRDKYVITAAEIAEHPDLKDGYDVVKVLRSQWLRVTRGSGGALGSGTTTAPDRTVFRGCRVDPNDPKCTGSSSGGGGGGTTPVPHESGSPYAESGATMNSPGKAGPVVYINEIRQDGLDQLRTLRPADIFEARYMTGNEASGRYGAGHENGAILVKTVRFGKG
jgi:hypothetical protein